MANTLIKTNGKVNQDVLSQVVADVKANNGVAKSVSGDFMYTIDNNELVVTAPAVGIVVKRIPLVEAA